MSLEFLHEYKEGHSLLCVVGVYCKESFVFYLIGEATIYGFQIKALRSQKENYKYSAFELLLK